MASPSELVTDAFATARNYANSAQSQISTFTGALAADIQSAPTINLSWEALAAPNLGSVPARPNSLESIEAELTFDGDGSIAASKPGALNVVAPNIAIDDFTEPDPTVDFGAPPTLDFGVAPTISIGTAPTVPDIAVITVPDAPVITLPNTPAYLALATPTFAGVDLHASFLTSLETPPALDLVAPTPYSYSPGPEYSSTLLTALQSVLEQRIGGGTGLDPSVEAAIWDRARDRETNLAQASIDEVTRQAEAAGFSLPTGALNVALRQAQREYYEKVSGLSRDIAIKQADLEQQNLKETITSVIDLEGKLIDNAFRLEQLAFESAKFVAQNAVDIYNAQVTNYRALVEGYTAYANAYRTIIEGELAKVEVYKAEIQAELAKAQTNHTLVEQYKAEVQARLANVEVYRAQIEGAKALTELEGAKLAAVREKIQAFIAGINGETARVEAYKAQVQAQGFKAEAYRSGVNAQLATVEVYRAKAQAFSAKAGAQADKARAELAFYNSKVQAYSAEWEGWRARVLAESERVKAIAMKGDAALDGFRADVARFSAQAEASTRLFAASISQYEAQKNYVLTGEKLNSEIIRSNNDARLEASKVGAQAYAQLAASAYSIIKAQAQISGSGINSVSYQYSNQTTGAGPITTAV